ncbi:extracellular solute-binding protein [Candidatus Symbiobacter mobilis]|uniref:ABC-type oligopeptide transporter substrate-binding protein n=1 Tax=Candidatus Symbiobacter mobilis CR TaxID=946483 RepID=U5NA75_9BURK|nr:extracellular solute-binding protein [Candidatus Symbiobacter mobilis]AGX87089.1 ABC-type oligopeptide transporter substrate-binding protein [Candidatus Symbiobacter mobilis CR]
MYRWIGPLLLTLGTAWAGHGYSWWETLRYPPDFSHVGYVQPNAPKGGELRLASPLRVSSFDKLNPFTLRGSAPAYLSTLLFDTLLAGTYDEVGTGYGLLAQDVTIALDRRSVTFTLRPQARFHNGDAVLASDVRYSFEMLLGPHASPVYRTVLADLEGIDVVQQRVVRFRMRKPNRELPLTIGSMPIFSPAWGRVAGVTKPFDQIVMDTPVGSGPYRIGALRAGRDIVYVRDPQYWGRDLPIRRGTANFDRIVVKIYQDNTARIEAIQAGEIDWMRVFSAADWARRMRGRRFDAGELVRQEFGHRLPSGFQSYVLNTRRPWFRDVRVRQALGLALDFAWMNRQLFHGAYQRVQGLFGNTDCQATGTPTTEERAVLGPWRSHIPIATWGTMPGEGEGQVPLRQRLLQARDLLQQAGWMVRQGRLRNAEGVPFEVEYLDSSEGSARVVSAWVRNLDKLGITLRPRFVDFAIYQQRLQQFDFDIVSLAYAGSHFPGQEYEDLFGSAAAVTEHSGNLSGIANPAVDALLHQMIHAPSQAAMRTACRALDRVIAHSHVLLPQWFASAHRVVYDRSKLAHPAQIPPYSPGEAWAIDTWWAVPDQDAASPAGTR